ncbi:hypothetical protein WR25_10099 [Diploscapter pachys]|uniref:Uncharacterized protein n=1 Tax=Diploscapter pachys TaxID=2018661 RepID=A0A2A2JIC0_9BILA|nr:hypothetical protein WR25_10099 [Diploscapter pachys]
MEADDLRSSSNLSSSRAIRRSNQPLPKKPRLSSPLVLSDSESPDPNEDVKIDRMQSKPRFASPASAPAPTRSSSSAANNPSTGVSSSVCKQSIEFMHPRQGQQLAVEIPPSGPLTAVIAKRCD